MIGKVIDDGLQSGELKDTKALHIMFEKQSRNNHKKTRSRKEEGKKECEMNMYLHKLPGIVHLSQTHIALRLLLSLPCLLTATACLCLSGTAIFPSPKRVSPTNRVSP